MAETEVQTPRSGDHDIAEPAGADETDDWAPQTLEEANLQLLQSVLDKLWAAAEQDKALFLSGAQTQALASLIIHLTTVNTQMAAVQQAQERLWVPPAPGEGIPTQPSN